MELAGGSEFSAPWGIVRSANITPDIDTGIGGLSKEEFLNRFTEYRSPEMQKIPARENNTVMPWLMYAGMSDDDLDAIYSYLRTAKPVRHSVERHSTAKK